MAKRKKKTGSKKGKDRKNKPKDKKPPPVRGRPPLYKSPEKFGKKIDEYFGNCITMGVKGTVPGLALHLGFETRQALADLRIRLEKKVKDLSTRDRRAGGDIIPGEFIRLIKRARLTIESQRMSDLVSGRKGMSTRGMEFDLQCNFGYVPKTAVEQSGEVTHINKTTKVLPGKK